MKPNNYIQVVPGKWIRRSGTELDRLCEQQRIAKFSHLNGFRYRRLTHSRSECRKIAKIKPPKPIDGQEPVDLSEAFLRGYLGGLPKDF